MYLKAAAESLLLLILKKFSSLASVTITKQIILLHLLTAARSTLDLWPTATTWNFSSTFHKHKMVTLQKQIYSNIPSGWFQYLSFVLGAQTSIQCTFQWNTQAQIVKYVSAMTVIEASPSPSLLTPQIKKEFHSSNINKFL